MASRKAGRGQPRVPPSPAEFAKCSPALVTDYPTRWLRLAARTRPLHDWDDRAVSRFSHPTHPFRILYLADEKETAFWEVFGAAIEDMPVDNRAISRKAQVDPRQWVTYQVPKGLRLVDVTTEATMHALRSNAGTWLAPYKHCQAWAEALMLHPLKLDGFIYQACRRGETARCLALFARPTERIMEVLVPGYIEIILGGHGPRYPALTDDTDFLRILTKNGIDLR